ncbi:MAG: lanthionine synthetase LanC family protein [Saprospiraceae bacterium]
MKKQSELTINVETIVDEITSAIKGTAKLTLHNTAYDTGLLGYSLYYAYLAKYKNEDKHIATSEEYFEKAIAALDINNFHRTYDTDSIDTHLSQIGRFVCFTRKHNLLNIDAEDYLLKLDDILFDLVKSKISIKDFDYGSGAMASGFYFLDRLKEGVPVEDRIKYIVHSLENFAEKDSDGDYFWQSPSLYDRVYLGISHGSCLMISFLCTAYECNVEKEACKRIIEKAVNFVIKQFRGKSKYKGLFPNKIGDEVDDMQFALCYGDIGNGYALYRASKVLESERIKTFTELVLSDCLLRNKKDNLTLDPGIYYGASGLVIAFSQVAKVSDDVRFKDRAKYWYDEIPNYKIHNNDFAGFQSRLDEDSKLWNISFGWGIIGVGITLMAYSDNELPSFAELTFVA